MNRILVVGILAVIGIVPTTSAQQKSGGKSEQAKAGDLPRGKPGPGMVWVDSQSKTYYRQGHPRYGKSKKGTYMSEGDAVNFGYHDSTVKADKK
jgi:hypothetical protein